MIPHYKGNIPFIDTEQMKQVDRSMINNYGISLIQMMENAGHNLAMLAKTLFLKNEPSGKKVYVLAGSGGNGGGALVAARRLKNWGANVCVILTSPVSKLKKETMQQLSIIEKMKIPISDKIETGDLIIDGMIGYGVSGNLKGRVSELIEQVAGKNIPVLSLDTPSGLDLSTGKPGIPTIKANATMILALPKVGLFKASASKYIGDLYLADISVPLGTYKSLGIDTSSIEQVFKENTVVKINKVVVFG
jgi:NAD(P)H-hydrate epimerase